jgi:hypothetical protein
MGKIKKLGGAIIVTAFAFAALQSSAASAKEIHIEGTAPFTVKTAQSGSVVYRFEEGLTLKCEEISSKGTVESNAFKTLELQPSFSGCTAFGFSEVTSSLAECADQYTVTLLVLQQYEAALAYDIACTIFGRIVIKAGTCELEIPAQTGKEQGGFNTLATSPKSLEIVREVSGIEYNKLKDGFLCPFNGTGKKTDGKIEGTVIAKAFEGSTQRGIYVE